MRRLSDPDANKRGIFINTLDGLRDEFAQMVSPPVLEAQAVRGCGSGNFSA